ncbi:hypothetical protein BD410DRAFT_796847 [Rickenella mellea]|uniref:Uncharacterized protein n=1 Tax=Rickenella mellea TaxID=50990 RepID=A0A4Y7PHJ0_9AGAM|nr:hypothetical protein BD410DRAFT_796847 [Rickenella mellea]
MSRLPRVTNIISMLRVARLQYLRPKWSHSTTLRHLRFHDCVMLDEKLVKKLAKDILSCEEFQLLELISCHKISEEFLIDLQDELGERLTS